MVGLEENLIFRHRMIKGACSERSTASVAWNLGERIAPLRSPHGIVEVRLLFRIIRTPYDDYFSSQSFSFVIRANCPEVLVVC